MTTHAAPPATDAPKPVASVRHPVIRGIADPAALTVLFGAAAITFVLLAIGAYVSSDVITRAAGYTGCVVGILSLFGCFASVVNATRHRTVIPLGSRGR